MIAKMHPLNNSNVSNVTDVYGMYGMFADATSSNQPLNNWNVSNVTDISQMGYMFMGATSFNQPLHAPWWPRERAYDHEESESERLTRLFLSVARLRLGFGPSNEHISHLGYIRHIGHVPIASRGAAVSERPRRRFPK